MDSAYHPLRYQSFAIPVFPVLGFGCSNVVHSQGKPMSFQSASTVASGSNSAASHSSSNNASGSDQWWGALSSIVSAAMFITLVPAGLFNATAAQALASLWKISSNSASANPNTVSRLVQILSILGMSASGAQIVANVVVGSSSPMALAGLSQSDAAVWNRICQTPAQISSVTSSLPTATQSTASSLGRIGQDISSIFGSLASHL